MADAAGTEKPWYQKWWGMLILVLTTGILGVIGIYLIWGKTKWPKAAKIAVTVVVVAVSLYLSFLLLGQK
ncbi:hypothetical protein HYV82_05205 [Candidatus Woesearchaeota archaeon]|nr:hypothetical protein [Candidatus Woesearchaeota archaeon]